MKILLKGVQEVDRVQSHPRGIHSARIQADFSVTGDVVAGGVMQTAAERWSALIAEAEASELSRADFARSRGVVYTRSLRSSM
jgi:hypothetical protein